jgi:hypothetical protein
LKKNPILALALLLVSALLVAFLLERSVRPAELVNAPRFARVAEGFEPFLRRDVKSPRAAKRKQLFWMENTGGEGYAVDALASPRLFAALFPGYPEEMRLDRGLWHDYFQRTFEIDAYAGGLAQAYGREFNVILSWVGCLDIYEKYGADVVVMGTSETFRSVVADELADSLKASYGGQKPRTLLCTATAMQIDTASEIARRLKTLRPDLSPTVLYGLSQSVAFVEGKRNLRNGAEKRETLSSYDLQRARSRHGFVRFFETYHEVSFADLFPKATWDAVFPFTSRSLAENEWIKGYALAAKHPEKERAKGGYVPAELRDKPAALAADIRARMKPFYRVYDDYSDEKHCHSSEREARLQELADALKALGGRVFLFIPPTTPLASEAGSRCFREAVAGDLSKMAQTLNAPVRTDAWEAYGLSYADYVRPTFHPEAYKVDIQHTNYWGASKVTEKLGAWMKEAGR